MFKKLLRGILTVVGLIVGYVVGDAILQIGMVRDLEYLSTTLGRMLCLIFISLLFGIIFYLISPIIYSGIKNLLEYIEKNMQKVTVPEIVYGAIGALIALTITTIIARPLNEFHPIFGPLIFISINIISAIIGMDILAKKKDDITNILMGLKKNTPIKDKKQRALR